MKKTVLIFTLIAIVFGCNNNNSSTTPVNNTLSVNDPQIAKGMQLIAKSDCLTCHKVLEKSIGPSYTDVASKYPYSEANVSMLAQKIIQGGAGNWGQIQMLPHTDITEENAKIMIKYILSLKK